MLELYRLMHKDSVCGILSIDNESGMLENFRILDRDTAPFLGNADTRLMKRWWEARAVPSSRKDMIAVIHKAGCENTKEYLAKNLALSMTDSYWVCPEGMDLHWRDVNLYENFGTVSNGLIPYHNATSYDPNASLGGQMDKYWDVEDEPPVLVKKAYKAFGQQSVNEAFATLLHERQGGRFPFVRYAAQNNKDGGINCFCAAFTDINVELVPAMEIIDARKTDNSMSTYDAYIKTCSDHGIDEGYIRDYMDYLTLTDFAISNTDEHLMNFGILRDPSTMRFLKPAPVFDSGNSMFYGETREKPFDRYELLERKITAIHDKEEAMLKHISDRGIVYADALPTPAETKEFYLQYGIPENRAMFIADCYRNKLSLLEDFQKGKTISLYHEKKNRWKPITGPGPAKRPSSMRELLELIDTKEKGGDESKSGRETKKHHFEMDR